MAPALSDFALVCVTQDEYSGRIALSDWSRIDPDCSAGTTQVQGD